jgi:hypothetical protein
MRIPPTLAVTFAALSVLPAQNTGLNLTNGVDAYVDVPYAPTVVPRSGITFEAWITYNDATLGSGWRWPTVVRQNSTPGAETFMLRVNAGQTNTRTLLWMVRTTSGIRQAQWNFTAGQLTTWTHVAGTYDGVEVRLYINGAQVVSVPGTGAITDTGGSLRIGNGDLSAAGIEEWNGEIDEVRLWPFARTAGEIAATMNLELSAAPGEVSTWNLNNNANDSSGSNNGQLISNPTFGPNTLNLTAASVGGANFGTASTGCSGLPRAVQSTLARIGSTDFAVGAIRSTATGSGLFWLSTASLSMPINIFGINLWINPAAPGVQVAVPGGPLGYARIPLPIPNNAFLANRTLMIQTIWAEVTCATPLFASDGLAFVIVP